MKKFNISTNNQKREVYFSFSKYGGKNLKVNVIDAKDGFSLITLSVNMPDHPKPEGKSFYVKTWSENEEIFLALYREKILLPYPDTSIWFSENMNNRKPMLFTINEEYC